MTVEQLLKTLNEVPVENRYKVVHISYPGSEDSSLEEDYIEEDVCGADEFEKRFLIQAF